MQDRMEESRQLEFAAQESKRQSEREKEFIRTAKIITERERDIESLRAKIREEQLAREKEIQRELEAREALFAERERKLLERQREFEHQLMRRQDEAESLRHRLAEEVAVREARLQQAAIELEQEKERYKEDSRKRIEQTSKDYVAEALELLDRKEGEFHQISKAWAGLGALALVSGLAFFGYITLTTTVTASPAISWEYIVYSVSKGLIAVALLAALARYAFLFSNSYMREALKNADRRHAINFGKFYLESYGAAAEWSQVKEAFANWNTTGSNAFSPSEDVNLDITALEKATALFERVAKSLPKSKGGDGA